VDGKPVIGPAHVDNTHFLCTPKHWHLDSRFVDAARSREAVSANPRFGQPVHKPHVCTTEGVVDWPPGNFAEDYLEKNAVGMATMALYLGYNKTKALCGICPHKGMPIQGGLCSGHRLRWLPDGTVAHKPPYTIRIRGSKNHVVLSDMPENGLIEITFVEACDPNVAAIVDFIDKDGTLVSWHDFGMSYGGFRPGDVLKISQTAGCKA